jgi:transposase
LAKRIRQRGKRVDIPAFFIRLGARYRRIRKRPRGIPSPQLYEYKTKKLQELETLYNRGEINLFYGDESHVCTEGYVPYGWQFPGEDVYIPSERAKRLNIFGMINRDNRFEGFSTIDSINAQKVVSFLDQFSFGLDKKTFVVLDNASVHRNAKIRQMRPIWEKRGLFLFYIPPYSPHLNIVETLWRVIKGKWLRPQDYACAETLFYATNRVLVEIGRNLRINYAHNAA